MKKLIITICVILSIVGGYKLYNYIKLTNEINHLMNEVWEDEATIQEYEVSYINNNGLYCAYEIGNKSNEMIFAKNNTSEPIEIGDTVQVSFDNGMQVKKVN